MLPVHCFTITQRSKPDPRAQKLLADAEALGFSELRGLEVHDLYFIEGQLSEAEKIQLAAQLLHDPITQDCDIQFQVRPDSQVIETALRPGVTDPVAEQIVRGAHLLGIKGVTRAASGQRFALESERPLSVEQRNRLAQRLFVNPVIHHYAFGNITVHFPQETQGTGEVEVIPIRNLSPTELETLSKERRTALDQKEMLAVQEYYRKENRDPTDVELETIAQTWSEHCCHKTFRAEIQLDQQNIQGLLKTYIRAATEKINAPWVLSAFVDNAGIIEFDDEYQISFKVETHNHPSAIEPFGGANTGLGGVIRDVLGVSAKPIAATDIFCFGPQDLEMNQLPEGALHPRLIRSGVVSGVQDYGNKTGIPTVNGAIWYDAGYTANPLVFCGCVGISPRGKHPRSPQPGDCVIALGGRTGRDGLRGATFSSMTMDAQTGEVAGASVQIGDPIIAKGLIEVVTRARDLNLYHAVTDCGAGGFSSAVGEMASTTGANIDISHVPLKYPGLLPWEIWLSEAQERMVLAVPLKNVPELQKICDLFDIELTHLGAFTDTQQLIVHYNSKVILSLSNEFLHDGVPQRKLVARRPQTPPSKASTENTNIHYGNMLLKLLSHPNIASKADVIRLYDHEIQAGTVVKPLTGIQNDGPSDACVIKPLGTKGHRGFVLSNGLNPEFGKIDAYSMAVSVIDEAMRNAIAVGANPEKIAILDNFCWGDPKRAETLGALVEAARGCYDGAMHYRTPFISGKDSLNNEYVTADKQRHAIPATLLISAIGIIDDVTRAVTMDFKSNNSVIYLIGETKSDLLGSHYYLCGGAQRAQDVLPQLPVLAPRLYRQLHRAIQQQLIRACHDLSEGGLSVAIAEMCIAGRMGCELTLESEDVIASLYSESNGRLLVEVDPEKAAVFEACFADNPEQIEKIGMTNSEEYLKIFNQKNILINLSLNQLVSAWQS